MTFANFDHTIYMGMQAACFMKYMEFRHVVESVLPEDRYSIQLVTTECGSQGAEYHVTVMKDNCNLTFFFDAHSEKFNGIKCTIIEVSGVDAVAGTTYGYGEIIYRPTKMTAPEITNDENAHEWIEHLLLGMIREQNAPYGGSTNGCE